MTLNSRPTGDRHQLLVRIGGAASRFDGGLGSGRKFDSEGGAAPRRTRCAHLAAVFTHHTEHDGKSKTRAYAGGFGGKEGIEDTRENRLGNARTIVDDLQDDPAVAAPRRAQPDSSCLSFQHDGLAGVPDQIHQHLLQLARVAGDEWKSGIEVQLDVNSFRGRSEALQIHGALHHLIEGHALALGPRLSGAQQELAQDSTGALGFRINLARFLRPSSGIFSGRVAAASSPESLVRGLLNSCAMPVTIWRPSATSFSVCSSLA